MDVLLFILAGLFIVAGTAGSVLPVLPGVPLGYAGLLLLQLTDRVQYSAAFLLAWAAVVVAIQVLDYYIPVWGTKRFGGTRAGTVGSTVGIVAGLFLGPWGVVLGPFAGAVLGELLAGRTGREALRAGFGSFVGFITGTLAKLVVCGFFVFYYVKAVLPPTP